MSDVPSSAPRYAIRIAAQRSGITPDTIRAWERRYRAVDPARSGTDRRLYSDADIERLRLLREVVDRGHSIGSVAALPREELLFLLAGDRAADTPPTSPPEPGPVERAALRDAHRAMIALDAHELRRVLARAAMNLDPHRVIEGVLAPLCRSIGNEWASGAICTAHEHLASVALRVAITRMMESLEATPGGPALLVATPSGERHELGAMMAAAVAASCGWRVTYLGPDLPAEDIGIAARQLNIDVVMLSIVHRGSRREHDDAMAAELRALRAGLGDARTLIVGGSGSAALTTAIEAIGAQHIDDFAALRSRLEPHVAFAGRSDLVHA